MVFSKIGQLRPALIMQKRIPKAARTTTTVSTRSLAPAGGTTIACVPHSNKAPALLRWYSTITTPKSKLPFFSTKTTLKAEVVPLLIFVGTMSAAGIYAVVHHLIKDKDLRLRRGASIVDQDDEALKKAVESDETSTPVLVKLSLEEAKKKGLPK